MRRAKTNLGRNYSRIRRRLPAKLISITAISVLALYMAVGFLGRVLLNSDYFKIKDIIVLDKERDAGDLSYLKGRNIFALDFKKESGYLSELYPDYKKISLVRILPNRLFIDFSRRKPLATVKLYRLFLVDQEAVLFSDDKEIQNLDLPVILGLETKIFGVAKGKRYNIKELSLALSIIKELKRNSLLRNFRLKSIEVPNLSNVSILLAMPPKMINFSLPATKKESDYLLEVKINQEDIKYRIDILSNLIIQARNDWGNIKYIDLRFKEPVIKLRDTK